MAFSTQKDFLTFNFPMNRKKSENLIKTYESCTDTRAWSMDNTKRAKYLAEIVQKMKQMPVTGIDGAGDGSRYFSEAELEQMSQAELVAHVLELYKNIQSKNTELKATEKLLKDASEKFESIDKVIRENKELRNEIKASKEKIMQLEKMKAEKLQERLSHELLEKVEMIHDLRTENTNLKSQLGAIQSSVEEISELRKRSEILDKVIQERKNLTEKMKKMEMVEDAIIRLKEKALLADQLAEENQKMCQVLEILKKKLQEDTSDGHQAKLEAQNRFMKDRLGQVESLVEEIAIYKAENIDLHRQVNDLRQKIVNLKLLEVELHQTKELLRRREAEVEDCEMIIHKCMIKIDRQDREIKMGAKRMQELCKMQQDLEMLHERVGISYGGDDQHIVELGSDKENVEHENIELIAVKTEQISSTDISEDIQELQKLNEKLTSEVEEYQKKIKSLEDQLETCLPKIRYFNETFGAQTSEYRENELVVTSGPDEREDSTLHNECLREISIFKKQAETCQELKNEIVKKLNDQDNEVLTLRAQNTDLEKQAETCKQIKDDLVKKLEEQEAKFHTVMTQNKELEAKVTTLQQEIETKADTSLPLTTLEPLKIDATLDNQAGIQSPEEKLIAIEKENATLRKEIDALKSDLEKQVNSSLDVSTALKTQVEELQDEKESCQEQLKQVIFEKDSLQQQLNEIGAVTDDLEQEREKNNQIENQRIKELEDEVERLNLELQNQIQKRKDYKELIERTMPKGDSGDNEIQGPETEVTPTENVIDNVTPVVPEEKVQQKPSQLQLKSLMDQKEMQKGSSQMVNKFLDDELVKQRSSQLQIKFSKDELEKEKRRSVTEDRIRKSYESEVHSISQRFDTKIKELQELHDLEKEAISKKHDGELDAMRLQVEALENELKKFNERCKCGLKKPLSVYNTDERLAKICRDVQEFGLEPCLMNDLLYLKDQNEKAIMKKEDKLKFGQKSDERLKLLLNEFTRTFENTNDNVKNLKQLVDDDIPVKIPAKKIPFTQPVPSDVSFPGIPKAGHKGRKSQARVSNSTNKPRTSKNNTRVMSLNITKDGPSGSKCGQTNVLYRHDNKTIKITDKPDNEHQCNGKSAKRLK